MNLQEAMARVEKAREQGRAAFATGKRLDQNPYSPFEDELDAGGWDDGYTRAAQAANRARLAKEGGG